MATHAAGVHLGFEERRCPLDQRRQVSQQATRGGRTEASHFPQEPEHRRVPGGEPEHGAHHRLHPPEAVLGLLEGPHEPDRHLGGAAIHDRLEEHLLGGVPVQDRLLPDPELAGQVVERRAVVATGAEGVHGGAEDAIGSGLGGAAHGSPTPVYQMVDRRAMISERLDGRRLAITGGTGFLGTALIERLLRCAPGCQLVLLIRPGRRSTVEQHAQREIFGNNAFERLRADLGREGFERMVEERVTAIAGDVGTDGLGLDDDGRTALASCDIVIHSAATVSFDSPLDSAVEVNLLGPTRIVGALHDLGVAPHLVSVSTCYVAGNRRGAAPEIPVHESPFFVDVDWRAEVRGARQARADAEADSRRPESLVRFRKERATSSAPPASPRWPRRRSSGAVPWVKEQMVEAGRARAASLGWPDAYAYTKALGERALLQNRGDVPVSIVRPSIIESAVHEPYPGWIRGFRMAEPVIISYARGLLKEFPGVPEGTVDVIPVDLVVAAIIDAGGRDPPVEPTITQVASGSTNPLRYRHLVDLVSTYFTEHPIYDAEGQPIIVPEWSFPGRGRVQRQLERAKGAIERGERVLQTLPLRGRQAAWAATLEEKREEVDRALAYVELYGAYAECEAIYGVDRLLARWDALDPEDQATFCFDPRVIDWDHYAPDVHLPSVVEHLRACGPPPAGAPARSARSAAPPGVGPRPALRGVRPREHPHRLERRGLVLVAGHATAAARGSCPLRAPDPPAKRPPCSPPTGATAATSSATSTVATTAPTSSSSNKTPSRCSATSSSRSRSPPPCAVFASTGPSATAPC